MKLAEFLVNAKKNTYAKISEQNEKRLENGGKQLTFTEGNLKYVDTYYGNNTFVGEEVVSENEKAMWSMNYSGKITAQEISKEIITVLKKALNLVTRDMPFRGPRLVKDADFEYNNDCKGTIEWFKGDEIISYKGKEVYRLTYSGGMLK